MEYLPLFTRLDGRPCTVIGGGRVAERKARELLACGAEVSVVSPSLTRSLEGLADSGEIRWIAEPFAEDRLQGQWLVVAATSDRALNARVFAAAEAQQRFCNVVDDAGQSSFISPAVLRRDPVTIAVSTGGSSPVIARWVKGLIEAVLPAELGRFTRLAGSWRERVKSAIPDMDLRRRFWETLLESSVPERCYAGDEAGAEAALDEALAAWRANGGRRAGEAYLVGAGPGSPDLITLRGRQLLAQAEVVLYDRLVEPAVLDYARRDAELIFVGKRAGTPSITQKQINRLLVERVKSGKRVCRLKGGDPMIFGRGGEELEALAGAGLAFQVVPGVSAVTGCAAYAGIPLTLRGAASTLLLTTGHGHAKGAPGLGTLDPGQTLALYMGVSRYTPIAAELIAAGNSPSLPVAIVERGTTLKQRVIVCALGDLAEASAELDVESPALLLVGATTELAARYRWFAPEGFVHYKGGYHAQSQRQRLVV
jgi:uroporphyrin-III C-methyltransferase/precorrin-2 dehydrogenase/sirohydrochlorin ferrochelatase